MEHQTKMVHKTIRIEAELWEQFKKMARYKDSDASKEIRKFVKRYIAENSRLFVEIDRQK
ncbi:MAG: hypothetical protein C6I05_00100 [Epsilonproteobacteria bacterium]|nr:hypothetical protein [Campylobacterota bacterium]